MHFAYIVFAVVCFLFLRIRNGLAQPPPEPYDPIAYQPDAAGAQPGSDAMPPGGAPMRPIDREDSAEYYEDRISQVDSYTFVALIDIVFTDGYKRTCTGAIISDRAVITAAHCFITRNEQAEPELTLSFVILGTKKMFETGYEMYLPIERVVTHPNFKGWTADLALLFTFAGLVTDKPGTIVPLAGERSSTPVDSNVTVFSWGRCNNDGSVVAGGPTFRPEVNNQDTAYPPGGEDVDEPTQIRANLKGRTPPPVSDSNKKPLRSGSGEGPNTHARFHIPESQPEKLVRPQKRHLQPPEIEKKFGSRYLTDEDGEVSSEENRRARGRPRTKRSPQVYKNGFDKNRRRVMEPTQNKLTMEVFGFVNAQTCKKLVDRSVPELYMIKNKNEILCYASDGHYITVEDSGAPALQHGKLVAVTVGGVESEGEHVAIGMKMSCFCSWIVENLLVTDGKINIKCCKNCCEIKHLNDNMEKNPQSYKALRKRSKHRLRTLAEKEEYGNNDDEEAYYNDEQIYYERREQSEKHFKSVPTYYKHKLV